MNHRLAFQICLLAVSFAAVYAKGPERQSGEVTAMDVIRTLSVRR